MSLFDRLRGGQKPAAPTMAEAMQRLRANPVEALKAAGLSIPTEMSDPQQMVQHLLQSGQVPPAMVQAAQRMAAGMRL